MYDLFPCNLNFYLGEYKEYSQFSGSNQYLIESTGIYYESDICKLLKYDGKPGDDIFLIVPSIFNSPEIMFLGKNNNFIDELRSRADIYLVNWQECGKQLQLSDYSLELVRVINKLSEQTGKNIHLIGHCLGGNLAIGAGVISEKLIDSITLMNMPWDYSHLYKAAIAYKSMNFENIISNFQIVPKIYIQIMFFLLFPEQFQDNVRKYNNLKTKAEKLHYLQIQQWLSSGIDISLITYKDIINNLLVNNMLVNNGWYVGNRPVDLQSIELPICIISAKDDQIAPPISMLPLQKQLKNHTLLEVKGGHISYLVNGDQNFQQQYIDWLKNKLN